MTKIKIVKNRKNPTAQKMEYYKEELSRVLGDYELAGWLNVNSLLSHIRDHGMDNTQHTYLVQDPIIGGLIHKAAYDAKVMVSCVENRAQGLVQVVYGFVENYKERTPQMYYFIIPDNKARSIPKDAMNQLTVRYGVQSGLAKLVPVSKVKDLDIKTAKGIVFFEVNTEPLQMIRQLVTKQSSKELEEYLDENGFFTYKGGALDYHVTKDYETSLTSGKDSHYKHGSIEPLQIIGENKLGYSYGAILKYISRMDFKGQLEEDKRKILNYLDAAYKYGESVEIPVDKAFDYSNALGLRPRLAVAVFCLLRNELDDVRFLIKSA